MANFSKALEWLEAGKKVRRNCWSKGLFIELPLGATEGTRLNFFLRVTLECGRLADDWELY